MPFALGEGERSPLFGEVEAVASTPGVVAHRLVGALALVGDKGERKLLVGVEGLSLAHLRRRRLGNWCLSPRLIVRTCHRVVVLGARGLGGWDQHGEGKQGQRYHQRPLGAGEDPRGGSRPCTHLCARGLCYPCNSRHRYPLPCSSASHDGFALLAQGTLLHMPASICSMLAINASYSKSSCHAMPLVKPFHTGAVPPCGCALQVVPRDEPPLPHEDKVGREREFFPISSQAEAYLGLIWP